MHQPLLKSIGMEMDEPSTAEALKESQTPGDGISDLRLQQSDLLNLVTDLSPHYNR